MSKPPADYTSLLTFATTIATAAAANNTGLSSCGSIDFLLIGAPIGAAKLITPFPFTSVRLVKLSPS